MYSNLSYEHSYKEGIKNMLQAPSYRIFLHNSGKKDKKSIIVDYSKKPILTEKNINHKIMKLISKKCINLKLSK